MKINHLQPEKVHHFYQKQNKSVAGNNGIEKHDSLAISDKALKIKELKRIMAEMPEVREEKIKQLKAAIQKGEYKVNPRAIALKILTELEQE